MASSARIDELRKKFDENPRRYFAPLANEYRKAGDIDQAIFICQEHLPQQPGHMSGHIVYGQALFEAKRFEEARAVFETALALDPENLIALRQLGDIARELGDTVGACTWYQRVLDADPRNDEIAGVLKTLQAQTTHASPATTNDEFGAGPTTVVPITGSAPIPGARNSGADLAVEGKATEAEIAIETSTSADTQSIVGHASEQASLSPGRGAQSGARDEFTVVIEPTSRSDAHRPTEQAPQSPSSSMSLAGFETSQHEHAGPPDQVASVPSGSELDEIDALFDSGLATGVDSQHSQRPDVYLPAADEIAHAAPTPASSPPPVAGYSPSPSDERPDPQPSPPAAAFVTETMAELYLRQGHREEAIEVYRQLVAQHMDNALLRQRLAELERQTPASHASLQKDVATEGVELGSLTSPSFADVDDAPAMTSADAVPVDASPTIRELLGAIAQRRPAEARANAAPTSATSGEYDAQYAGLTGESQGGTVQPADAAAVSDETFGDFAAESMAWSEPAQETEAHAPAQVPDDSYVSEPNSEPSTGERQEPTVVGSIDDLFVGASAAVGETDAASSAFGHGGRIDADSTEPAPGGAEGVDAAPPPAEVVPLAGKPARQASDELSLDHVFKEPAGGSGGDAAFSFDQFFAESASDSEGGSAPPSADQPPTASGPIAAAPPVSDDIEQFNAWLEGLKKS